MSTTFRTFCIRTDTPADRIRAAVDDAGYAGPIEVEIFNSEIWSRPGDKILATMKERYAALV